MWIHVPSISSASAQEWEDSTSELSLRCQLLEQSATSRSKPIAARSWLRAWKSKYWIRHLFGRISNVSTACRGVESWIASLEATRASRFHWQDVGQAPTIHDICGLTLPELSRKLHLASVSLKTSQGTLPSGSTSSSASWKKWVTTLRRSSLARKKWVLATRESASLSSLLGGKWPTPALRDHKGTNLKPFQERGGGKKGEQLANFVKHCFHLDQQTSTPGVESSTNILSSRQQLVRQKRRLNPNFVDWLMGWPIGWTDLEPVEMGPFQSWQHTHSVLLLQILSANKQYQEKTRN